MRPSARWLASLSVLLAATLGGACSSSAPDGPGGAVTVVSCSTVCGATPDCGGMTCVDYCEGVEEACARSTSPGAASAFGNWATCQPTLACVGGTFTQAGSQCPGDQSQLAACSSTSNPVDGGKPDVGATNPGACASLSACCLQVVDSSSKEECEDVVAMADASSCAEAQADFTQDDLCGGSMTGGGSPACTALATCCSVLSSSLQTACNEVVAAANASTCGTELTSYETIGECGGTTMTGGTGCTALTACCASLSASDATSCEAEVTAAGGSDTECTEELTAYQSLGMCTGTGSGTGSGSGSGSGGSTCGELSACCGSLPSADQSTCEEYVSSGVAADCSAALSTFMESGYCGGLGSGSGSGASTSSGSSGGGGCAALSVCCASLTSDDQEGCEEIVSEGDAAECSEELEAYTEAGDCT
jgi:hypothetical protein